MLTLVRASLFLLLVAHAAPVLAQAPTVDGQPRRYGDPFVTKRDTVVRSLSGPWQLWTHVGIGWNSGPSDVRERYSAGLDAGLSGDRRFLDRFALRGRFDFADLPSSRPNAVIINGVAYATDIDYGHGWLLAGTGGTALRLWGHLWIGGDAGVAYFHSGLGDGEFYEDLATGTLVELTGASGWGPLWSGSLRYEFQPGRRDRMLGELRYTTMDRDGVELRFLALRFGYRAF